jgi:hypothetical protein
LAKRSPDQITAAGGFGDVFVEDVVAFGQRRAE